MVLDVSKIVMLPFSRFNKACTLEIVCNEEKQLGAYVMNWEIGDQIFR
jgi:hypothetical protein